VAARPGWGSVARRGGRSLLFPPDEDRTPDRGRPNSLPLDEWVDEGQVRTGPRQEGRGESGRRRRARSAPRVDLPPAVVEELERAGAPSRARRLGGALQLAATAYQAERFAEARRLLEPVARRQPSVAAVRELHGLTLYRLGKWLDAVGELEAAEQLTGTADQHPVLADAHRALGHDDEVERLWDELRRAGVGVEVLTEGRIVTAATRADRGDHTGAIALLEAGPVGVRRPQVHHLRLWYALANAYERAGDVPRARALFRRLADAAPDFADAERRQRALG